MSEEGRTIKNLPTSEQMQYYNEALKLRREEDWGPTKIARELDLKIGTIKAWLYKEQKPDGREIKPNLFLSPTLSYILGTVLGDGCVGRYGRERYIKLEVIDKPFAEAFFQALEKINLHPHMQKKDYRNYEEPLTTYCVRACSKVFYEWFYSLKLDAIRSIAKKYSKHFIRGFYDSEGMLRVRPHGSPELRIKNSNKKLIDLVAELLKDIGFETSIWEVKGNLYELNLLNRNEAVPNFLKMICPSIPRKADLEKANVS